MYLKGASADSGSTPKLFYRLRARRDQVRHLEVADDHSGDALGPG
jgi:hypothetical protein